MFANYPYKVRLTKISKNENDLRTNSIEGFTNDLPKSGMSFFVVNIQPLDDPDANVRLVSTSIISTVEKVSETLFKFQTMNSVYQVEVLEK